MAWLSPIASRQHQSAKFKTAIFKCFLLCQTHWLGIIVLAREKVDTPKCAHTDEIADRNPNATHTRV